MIVILKKLINQLYDLFCFVGRMSGCHQMASRSFVVKNRQFPVCARCTGCFSGYIVGIFIYFIWAVPLYICISLCMIMLIDWSIQYLKIKESNNCRRFITGFLCGIGYINIFLIVLKFLLSLL